MIVPENDNIGIVRINEELISDVERPLKMLDDNRITIETRTKIKKKIRCYMRELREFRMVVAE